MTVRQRPEMKLFGLDFVALMRIAIEPDGVSETVYAEPEAAEPDDCAG